MDSLRFNSNAAGDHVAQLKADLATYPWGPAFLETLERSEYPVLPMPEDLRAEFPNSPALLNLDPNHTIYVTEQATADDLGHEIRHVEQFLSTPDDIVKCTDVKHRFIFHAFTEADSYAHQAALFVQMLVLDPSKRAAETEIFNLYHSPDADIMMEPVRVALYLHGAASPDDLVSMVENDEEALKKIMSFVFSWAFHEIIPKQYEERHLDAVHTALTKAPQSFDPREANIAAQTKADEAFFIDCIQAFGGIITNYEESYLIDSDGMGPDLDIHLAQIMTPHVIEELERINQALQHNPKGNIHSYSGDPEPKSSPS